MWLSEIIRAHRVGTPMDSKFLLTVIFLDYREQALCTNLCRMSLTSPMASTASMAQAAVVSPHHCEFFGMLVGNPLCSDVQLTTCDGVHIPAHKAILCAVSPTFRAMFGNAQHTEARCKDISVPYHSRSFQAALSYMYTGILPDEVAEPLELLDLSTYYCLEVLKDAAVAVMKKQTNAENTFDMLDIALRFGCDALRDHCITLIRQHNSEVIHAEVWCQLPLEVALLLVQETVIESDMEILTRCVEWCQSNKDVEPPVYSVDPASNEEAMMAASEERARRRDTSTPTFNTRALKKFLKFIDFTAMTTDEIERVEAMQCVPLELVYRAFKAHCLHMPPPHTPRKGGIILQWELNHTTDLVFNDNHVYKVSSDFLPRTVYAINRFAKGRHYFTFHVEELRSPHDCLVGVSCKATQRDYHFEPCCTTVCVPPGTKATACNTPGAPLLQDHRCVIGVEVDFGENSIRWYNHVTKQLLFSANPVEDDGVTVRPLEGPLVPSITLYHKSNGGVVLADCTSFLNDRAIRWTSSASGSGGGQTPKRQTSTGSSAYSPRASGSGSVTSARRSRGGL